MLATLVAAPFDRSGWVYEEKYDGDRILAYKEGDRVRLLSRNGKDRTERFPGIAAAVRALSADTLLLDGEVVIFDKKASRDFSSFRRAGASQYLQSLTACSMRVRICGVNRCPLAAP